MEDYAAYLSSFPKGGTPNGYMYIFQIRELDAIWIKVGDGKTDLIDLPHIVVR